MARRKKRDLQALAVKVARIYGERHASLCASSFEEVEALMQEAPEALEAVLTVLSQNGTVVWRDGAFHYTQEAR